MYKVLITMTAGTTEVCRFIWARHDNVEGAVRDSVDFDMQEVECRPPSIRKVIWAVQQLYPDTVLSVKAKVST